MYKSCNILLHGLCFYCDDIVSCCYAPNDKIDGGIPPLLFHNYKGEIIPKDVLFKKIREYSDQFLNGGCPKECENCFQIKEADWDEGEFINYITITHFSACNADCIYCSNNLAPEERTNNIYEIMPFLKYLKSEGVIKEDCEIHIGGGELTIYKECDELLEEFGMNGQTKIFIPTNAIKYSENLHKALKSGSAHIIVSLDSGSKELYKKIKRADAFDKVVENLKKYSQELTCPKISLKYIILPGINDSLKEFKKFLQIAKSINAYTIIDIDARYLRSVNNIINPIYLNLAKKMKKEAEKMGLFTELYSFLKQAMNQDYNQKPTFADIKDYIEMKYFKKCIKKLYTQHRY